MGGRYALKPVVLPRQPRLDQLVRVVPIGQMREASGIEVLALAVELYAAGFVVTFQLQSHGAVPFIDAPPRLTLRVTDERDREYRVLFGGATGEGEHRDWQWRHAYRCCPALPPDAAELGVTITGMRWAVPDQERQIYVPVLTVEGPWSFSLPLLPTGVAMRKVP